MNNLPQAQIEIALSKKKMILSLIGANAFVGIGIWLLISPPKIENIVFGNPVFIFTSAVANILFFGLAAFLFIKKLSDKAVGLTINDKGIIDNSSGVSGGLVLWSDVKEIKVAQVMSQKFLMVIVKNPQDYIKRQTNTFKRKTIALNFKYYGSPISISANALATNFDTLNELLQQKFNDNKLL